MCQCPVGSKSRKTPDKRMIICKEIFHQERQNGLTAESPAAFTAFTAPDLEGECPLLLRDAPVLSHHVLPRPPLGLCFTAFSSALSSYLCSLLSSPTLVPFHLFFLEYFIQGQCVPWEIAAFNIDNPTKLQGTKNLFIKAQSRALTTKYLQAYHYQKCSAADTHRLGENVNAHVSSRREHNLRDLSYHVFISLTLTCCTL